MALMHWLRWGPLCEPNVYAFLYYEQHRDPVWNWLAVKSALTTPLLPPPLPPPPPPPPPHTHTLPPPVVYYTKRSKAVVQVLVLLFVALWFSTRGDFFNVLRALYYFLLVFSFLSALRLPSFGEERANSYCFCTFVRIALVWFCLFPLPLGDWEGLRSVILTIIGIFSYHFFLVLAGDFFIPVLPVFLRIDRVCYQIDDIWLYPILSCFPSSIVWRW